MNRLQSQSKRIYLLAFMAVALLFVAIAAFTKSRPLPPLRKELEQLGGEIVDHTNVDQFRNAPETTVSGKFLDVWAPENLELLERTLAEHGERIDGLIIRGNRSNPLGLLPNFGRLKYLELNDVTIDSSAIGSFESLVGISLQRCKFTDQNFNLEFPATLEFVDVFGSEFANFQWLKSLPQLRVVYVGRTTIEENDLHGLASFDRIEALDVHRTNVTARGIKEFEKCENLKKLRIGPLYSSLSCLSNFSSLESLRLYDYQLTVDDLKTLASLKKLRHLTIGGQYEWSPSVAEEFGNLRLRSFKVFHRFEESMASKVSNMPELQRLELLYCSVSENAIGEILRANSLTELTLIGCPDAEQIVQRFSEERPEVTVEDVQLVGW